MNKYFFRVGNFANSYGNKNHIITEHDLNVMESTDTNAFIPIPLSEEWLVKLGFSKLDQEGERITSYYIKEVNKQEKIQVVSNNEVIKEIHLLFINDFAEEGWEFIATQSKFFFVHYLQNLCADHSTPGYPFKF